MIELRHVLDAPRREQLPLLRELRAKSPCPTEEAWNTRFGPASLYEAWSRTTVMRSVYAHNRRVLREVATKDGFRLIEIGGGNGRLWEGVFGADARGQLVLVDPVAEVHGQVRRVLPHGVELVSRVERVEDVEFPDSDAAVASLVLHHVAGADRAERARHGLRGPGKREVLERLRDSLAARAGVLIVNEADVFCDLALPAGDEVLYDRLIDSYVRRCARSLLDDLDASTEAERTRLQALIRRWCIDQIEMAAVPLDERDVYELDVPRWLDLFARSGFTVVERTFTDKYGLFVAYRAVPSPLPET